MIKQRKQLALLLILSVGMFGFAFALVPLYDVFCELTGINGRSASLVTAETNFEQPISVSDRIVTIQFIGKVGNGMPWEFRPTEHQLRVHPGEIYATNFYARNRANQSVTGQAVPSVAPGQAAEHLTKLECFCFTAQQLDAGAEIEMPVRFIVDTDLPEDIHTLTLAYTVYPVGGANL
jgi:cytochrome c oxidase assembly protein subunit 11